MNTPDEIAEIIQRYMENKLAEMRPGEDWSVCEARFSWCGELLDFLVQGVESHILTCGVVFDEPFPGPFCLWDEDHFPDGNHLRRFWTTALDQSTRRPLARICTLFSHRHDCVALPHPPQIRGFDPDHQHQTGTGQDCTT